MAARNVEVLDSQVENPREGLNKLANQFEKIGASRFGPQGEAGIGVIDSEGNRFYARKNSDNTFVLFRSDKMPSDGEVIRNDVDTVELAERIERLAA